MKALKITLAGVGFLLSNIAFSQTKPDSLGLPGDNFDLYGALELFKKADTPENFEKAINSNDNEVNNLDLDGDGKVDYVKVIDKKEGDGHTLVLQVAVSQTETQDVAVIEVDKTSTDKAHVQIVGDEELYGKDYIVEPKDETAVKQPTSDSKSTNGDDVYSKTDNSTSNNSAVNTSNNTSNYNSNPPNQTTVVNVWAWPSVQYIYGPSYGPWISPWYWNTYPVWWQPWRPVYWRYHYRRAYRYHYPYYHRVSYYRSPRIHTGYYGRRTSASMVQKNNQSGFYHQRQATYKNNVQPGKKYNNQPAKRADMQMNKQQLKEARPANEKNINGNKQNAPVKNQPAIKQQQPVKQNQNVQPRQQQQTQPKQQAQPKQQQAPRMQSAPKQRSQPANKGGGMRRK